MNQSQAHQICWLKLSGGQWSATELDGAQWDDIVRCHHLTSSTAAVQHQPSLD